jgi:predicted flap endonuclease-1-like 5' DNA nuclease
MSLDRSLRSILATLLLVAALLLAMSRIVGEAPLSDWLLPLILFIVGAAFIPDWDLSRMRTLRQPSAPPSAVQTYNVSTQITPRPHTMTIRPDPESAEFHTTVTVTREPSGEEILPFDEASPGGELLPYMEGGSASYTTPLSPDAEAPASPETPAPAIVAEPEPETEPVPVSPETPAPNAPEEPSVPSPETPAPAPELNFSARTEFANPDESVAKDQPPPEAPPDTSVTATPREPEKEIVAEKTAAPEQPYEAEQASAAGSGDALARLSGIGQKSAAALAAAGIDTFQKLADSSEDDIRAALAAGGVRLVGNVNHSLWVQQAAYAARGDWNGLAQFNADRKSSASDGD